MKKKLKILGISILILLVVFITLPFMFKGKIIELVKQTANNNINATLDFESADLSLLRSFPNTRLSLKNLYVINQAPFEGDTLANITSVDLELPFKSLFNDTSEPIQVNNFAINGVQLNIKIDSLGNANYDIAKNSENEPRNETSSENFKFDLTNYSITDSQISYHDAKSATSFKLNKLNHSGKGNFSLDESVLKTSSDALVSLSLNGIDYLKNNSLALEADVQLDVKNNRYTFLENSAKINELPLVFDGFIQANDANQEIDLTFKTPSSDFKNFLALIPKVYSKNIEGVTTTGNFDVSGKIKGIVDDTHIPTLAIAINSKDASFKYPDLPKSLNNININTKIINESGLAKDTYIAINKLSFSIDDEVFYADGTLSDLIGNAKVSSNLKGSIDLAKLEQIYPAEGLKGLQGLLNTDVSMAFDMNAIEQKKYENTKISGNASITDFEYKSEDLSNPLYIKRAAISFVPKRVHLNRFDATIGATDMNIKGSLDNFFGFLFNKETLEGYFKLQSNKFVVNDFMASSSENEKTSDSISAPTAAQLKIPSFLDATLKAKANTVVYDNITLNNVSGDLKIKDQSASLSNMKSDVFGGKLGFNGVVSTKTETPTFTMQLDATNFDIGQSFAVLDLFKALAPIANALNGKINTNISLSGSLNDDFTPDLATLTGDLLGQLTSSVINTERAPLLQKLTSNLSFFDAKKLNLENLKASLRFKDGKVTVKPFTLNYDDIEIAVGGGHGFDRTMDYDAVFNVPAKYLGKEAEKLISQLSDEEQNTIKVPITALLKGSFTNPSISTDLKGAIASLTKQVASNQKDKLVDKGKEQLNNALDKLLNKNKDTVKTDSTTTKKPDVVKETAKDLLNGLFGKKKKKEEVKKDTINKP